MYLPRSYVGPPIATLETVTSSDSNDSLLVTNGGGGPSVLTLKFILQVLEEEGKISTDYKVSTLEWIKDKPSQMTSFCLEQLELVGSSTHARRMSFEERSRLSNGLSSELFNIMSQKKTNVCLAIDETNSDKVVKLAQLCGPYVCMVKIHADILEDQSWLEPLEKLSREQNFLLFSDRKFADIGNTVKRQYQSGSHEIVSWAHVVTAHVFPGPGVVDGLKAGFKEWSRERKIQPRDLRGCFLLADMSSEGNLFSQKTIQASHRMAQENRDFVIGFICQQKVTTDPCFIHATPGVSLSKSNDHLGQTYKTPKQAIINGADMIIVGRSVTQANDPVDAIKKVVNDSFETYLSLC